MKRKMACDVRFPDGWCKEYIELLGTYSDHISLPAVERRDLFSGIADLIT